MEGYKRVRISLSMIWVGWKNDRLCRKPSETNVLKLREIEEQLRQQLYTGWEIMEEKEGELKREVL